MEKYSEKLFYLFFKYFYFNNLNSYAAEII